LQALKGTHVGAKTGATSPWCAAAARVSPLTPRDSADASAREPPASSRYAGVCAAAALSLLAFALRGGAACGNAPSERNVPVAMMLTPLQRALRVRSRRMARSVIAF
jgi:hypothetical protein